ncbi:MAG: HlyD family efflux transporter periplasmic adaptor subunit [Phycisphaeraceae bacterium]|nr:MAG: HlyD family efflux transporter periplasmic adaptor subunit [Phycisphaeraceae bacterium]
MKLTFGRIVTLVVVLGGAAAAVYALRPRPVEVETGVVERAPMRVMVEEDGVTRIRERYIVSAPLAGRLARVSLDPGDEVIAGQTVLATIQPTDPALLDARAQAEAEARVRAAQAAVDRAGAAVDRAVAGVDFAEKDLKRLVEASERLAATPRELETAAFNVTIARQDLRSAEYAREIARFELELAQSALTQARGGGENAAFVIPAPVSGRVLRVMQQSAAVVSAGAPIIEIGDPADLEAVVDVLSVDAVGIRPGDAVVIERWGGGAALRGAVRLVEPAAFTKVSALGVDEQRVNVVIDFLDEPEARIGLGDGFRIEAGIVVWRDDAALVVPDSALFRRGTAWAVFVIQQDHAVLRTVQVGRRNGVQAQVLGGLVEGDRVIVYPGDRVQDGTRVVVRAGRG